MAWKGIGATIAAILVFLIVLGRASSLVVDWAWFSSVGYAGVFWTAFATKATLFAIVFAVSALLLWINGTVALRLAGPRQLRLPAAFANLQGSPSTPAGMFGPISGLLPWRLLVLATALVVALLIAMAEIGKWELVLRFIYQVPYGQTDPLFGKDIGFYLFSLPVYSAFKNWMELILLLSAAMAGAVYVLQGEINLDSRSWRFSPAALAHGSALLGAYFAVKALSYVLDRYLLLYDDNGVVVGASYTDVHVELPILWLLIGIAAAAAIVAWVNVRLRAYRLLIGAAVVVFGSSFLLGELLPGMFQRFYVKPSELQLESPYLKRNIDLTQEAYNLRQITVKPFPVEQGLTYQSLQDNHETIDNIRLWDWQPLLDTYAQLQEIRTYYRFLDVDIDRYHIDGTYRQVTLAPRELVSIAAATQCADLGQPASAVHPRQRGGHVTGDAEIHRGTAELLPEGHPAGRHRRPSHHRAAHLFRPGHRRYVIVKGSTPEFDYPKGKDNVYANYDGTDGIPIGGMFWRSLFAWQFDDVNILLSSYVTGESRIMIHRNIQDRIETIAPFLQLDHDPYVVISDGRLYWMQDAYTTSDWFPYAQPHSGDNFNYIRNSVKVVVDAYNGTVTFYVMDTADPIIATYRRIFPALFKPFDAMPADLQRHIRYPEDLFRIQAQQYRAYHMDAPEVFYNREDLWQFPREPTGPDGNTDRHQNGALLHDHAPARRIARRVLPHAAHGAKPAREHDRLAGRAL